ncbi:uncharacterized protein [Miscanthus floridulus]|uniref:uncharacterized protein n=1 Tax=Miscanthus floridulus TaxID=154761 RepID=UPI0034591C4B
MASHTSRTIQTTLPTAERKTMRPLPGCEILQLEIRTAQTGNHMHHEQIRPPATMSFATNFRRPSSASSSARSRTNICTIYPKVYTVCML